MTGRERVKRAMHYQSVDKAPLQYYYCPVGYYEHGEKLNDLYQSLPGDFEPFRRMPIPCPPKEDFNARGEYDVRRRDEWGTLWSHRIFGIAGIAVEYPLADWEALKSYDFPRHTPLSAAEKAALREQTAQHQQELYCMMGGGGLFEWLKQMRCDEDVLCDLMEDEPLIHKIADMRLDWCRELVTRAIEAGADGIALGDDFGTERAMLISPALFRRFFKPRYAELLRPAVQAGLDIHFHSCGQIAPILEDLAELGVTSIWPQLPLYDMQSLHTRCKSLGLAVAIHTDRAVTMTSGTPQQVRDLVRREYDTFCMGDGGSWFYVEADNGFPFENIEALVTTIAEYR